MLNNPPIRYSLLAWTLLVIGAIISIVHLIFTACSGYCIGTDFDFEKTGQYGDYVGGVVGTIFALAGTILVYASFVNQQRRNTIESFEFTYFEMLKIHEDIVKDMNYKGKKSREVFPEAISELRNLFESVLAVLEDIKLKSKAHKIHNPNVADETLYKYLDDMDIPHMASVMSVGYLYYGIDDYYLTSKSEAPLYVVNELVKKELNTIEIDPIDNVLGHYYRQMFQIVKYVANTTWLSEAKKYDYIKMLRSQLSDYEQMMLFYNSLSVNGNSWREPYPESTIEKMGYIARFRLIKNIPFHYKYFGNHPQRYFATEIEAWKAKGVLFFENEIYRM